MTDSVLWFRPHRGSLDEAMNEAVIVRDRDGLFAHLASHHPAYGPHFDPEGVAVMPYCDQDARVGWHDIHIVTMLDWGVVGFTGMAPEIGEQLECWCPVGWKERFAQHHFADQPHIHIPGTCCRCRGLDSHCCA